MRIKPQKHESNMFVESEENKIKKEISELIESSNLKSYFKINYPQDLEHIKGICIEYDGDYTHGNPKRHKPTDKIIHGLIRCEARNRRQNTKCITC